MARQSEQNNVEKYNATLPTKLRELLESHPADGHSTTYKALGEAVGVRQQTISQYASGQTQPTADVALRIAQYFGVSLDYLLTGVSADKQDIHERTGLSDEAIDLLERAKGIYTFDGTVTVGQMIDRLLSDKDFYGFFDDLLFKTSLTKATMNMTEEQRKALSGMNLEGYYLWDLQMFVQEFIQREITKLGLDIKIE